MSRPLVGAKLSVSTGDFAALGGAFAKPATAAAASPALAPSVAAAGEAAYTEVPNSMMRKVIAQSLSQATRDIPHIYLSADCADAALKA